MTLDIDANLTGLARIPTPRCNPASRALRLGQTPSQISIFCRFFGLFALICTEAQKFSNIALLSRVHSFVESARNHGVSYLPSKEFRGHNESA